MSRSEAPSSLQWVAVELEIGTLGAKIIRNGSRSLAAHQRLDAVREAYAILHILAGHNGCLDKCWLAAIEAGEKRLEEMDPPRHGLSLPLS